MMKEKKCWNGHLSLEKLQCTKMYFENVWVSSWENALSDLFSLMRDR